MEAEKSPDRPSADWRPRRSSRVAPVQAPRPENQGLQRYESQSEGRRGLMSQLKSSGRETASILPSSTLGFSSCPQRIGRGPPTSGRASYFIQATKSNVHLIQEHLTDTSRNDVLPAIWASPSPVKLTLKIMHHECCRVLRWGRFQRAWSMKQGGWETAGTHLQSCAKLVFLSEEE